MLQMAVSQKMARRGGIGPASASRANRSEVSRFIRRVTDGVIAENQGKARSAGDLRVVLFPSKHSRVRIPSPALEADTQGRPASDEEAKSERTGDLRAGSLEIRRFTPGVYTDVPKPRRGSPLVSLE